MYLVGLTGGIAAGKSIVAARLADRGAELVEADEIAREVVQPGTSAYREIVQAFGRAVLDTDGYVDREALGELVFADRDKRAVLNEITHPRIAKEIADRLELLAPLDSVVVVDVPLLAEVGADRGYDAIVVVAAERQTQVERLMDQRGMDADQARARVDAQASLDERLRIATHVIWNESDLDALYAETDRVADELWRAAEEKAAREREGIPND